MDKSRIILKRWIWGIGSLAVFLLLVWKLERLSTLIISAFIVAYVLNPLVERMSKFRFLGRGSAAAITLVGLAVGFLAVLLYIIPEVAVEFKSFVSKLPEMVTKLQLKITPWVEANMGMAIPQSWNEAAQQVTKQVEQQGSKILAPAAAIATLIFGTTFSAIFMFLSALMFPLFAFFLLKDFPRIIEAIDSLIPLRSKKMVYTIARDVDKSLSAFLHGQFTVMLCLGVLYSIGYTIAGVPVAIGIGMFTGLLCFIPYVGAATGFIMALFLAALQVLETGQWYSFIGVVVVFAVVQILDAILITPRILGGKLGLTPLWIIAALMAGGELFGFVGVLLAVPTTAITKVLISHSIVKYRQSTLYRSPPEDLPASKPNTQA